MPQVQVIENRADLVGKIRQIQPHQTLRDHYTLTLDVESVGDVAEYPNLMKSSKGMSIEVTAPADEVDRRKLAAGQKVTLRVKKAGPDAVFLLREPDKAN